MTPEQQKEIQALRDKIRARDKQIGFQANVDALKARLAELEAQYG